jgi:DNA (cytosine-5)-methyltransferase 1
LTFLDLFAGIGGFRRGLERSGHTCVGHVEIDKYANKSYCAMYGLIPCKYKRDTGSNTCMVCETEVNRNCDGKNCKGEWYAKDIKQLRAGEIPKAEIWTFGFPCTDVSLAGRQAGLWGERSGLFFTVVGLLKGQSPENKPGRIIVENVKHLVSSERGRAFTAVLSELWEAGYDCEWSVVNSKDFYVPQHRERVYIVGHLRGQRTRKVFPVGGTNQTPVKQIVGGRQGQRIYDADGLSITMTAEGGGFAGHTGLYAVSVNRIDGLKGDIDEAHTLTSSDFRGINRNQDQNAVIEPMKEPFACFIDMNSDPQLTEFSRCVKAKQYAGVVHHRGETSGVFICEGRPDCARAVITPERGEKRQNGRRIKDCGEPGFTLTAQDQHGLLLCCCPQGLPIREGTKTGYAMAQHGDGINLTYPGSTTRRARVGDQISHTLLGCGGQGVLVCCRIRRLTPRECFRLQAFEDELFDRARAAGLSDAQLYRQAGNAVTVNVVYEIGVKLKD